jgi:hypothetical protein
MVLLRSHVSRQALLLAVWVMLSGCADAGTASACTSEARRLYVQMADVADGSNLDSADAQLARKKIAEFVSDCAPEGGWIGAFPGERVSEESSFVSILSFAAMSNSEAAIAKVVPIVVGTKVEPEVDLDEVDRHLSQAIETALYFESDIAFARLVRQFVKSNSPAERLAAALPLVSIRTDSGLRNLSYIAKSLLAEDGVNEDLQRHVRRQATAGDLRTLQCISSISHAAAAEIRRVLGSEPTSPRSLVVALVEFKLRFRSALFAVKSRISPCRTAFCG